jgi:DnaJ-class molecular chaperone
LQISVLDAILGVDKEITTIEGTKKKITVPKGIQYGEKILLKG